MTSPVLAISFNPIQTRLLLKWEDQVWLKAVLPHQDPLLLEDVHKLVDSLGLLVGPTLSVVLSVDEWEGAHDLELREDQCDDGECNIGHLECPASHREFMRLAALVEQVQS
jgi:hypothetical protein